MTEMRAEARRIAASTGQGRLLRLLDQLDAAPGPGRASGTAGMARTRPG